jgi:hypothetical protein
MGFNTVVMLLNDHMHELEKSPRALTYGLCHPPHFGEDSIKMWRRHIEMVAKEHGEPVPPVHDCGGLNILPTFHADDAHFIYAGRNSLERLTVHKFGTATQTKLTGGLDPKRVKTVTLLLPDWWGK